MNNYLEWILYQPNRDAPVVPVDGMDVVVKTNHRAFANGSAARVFQHVKILQGVLARVSALLDFYRVYSAVVIQDKVDLFAVRVPVIINGRAVSRKVFTYPE